MPRAKPKFNEEAHTLSYLYFKNGFRAAKQNPYMRRIWTNPLFYREVQATDVDLTLWHLPAEKTFGLRTVYDVLMNETNNFGLDMRAETYTELIQKSLGVPHLTLGMKMKYYTVSYYRAIKKRLKPKKVKPETVKPQSVKI